MSQDQNAPQSHHDAASALSEFSAAAHAVLSSPKNTAQTCILEGFSRDPFVIEGDSLLLAALQHPQIDFSATDGNAQFLPVVYVVERFLSQLLSRGGRFRVVFVREAADCWTGPLAFLRGVLVRHLTAHSPVPVDVVTAYARTEAYFARIRPSAILLSDEWGDSPLYRPCLAAHVLLLIGKCWDQGRHVLMLDMSELQYTASGVITYAVLPANADPDAPWRRAFQGVCEHGPAPEPAAPASPPADLPAPLRLAAAVLRASEQDGPAARAFLIAAALKSRLSLADRAHGTAQPFARDEHLAALFAAVNAALPAGLAAAGEEEAAIDVVDERLVHVVWHALAEAGESSDAAALLGDADAAAELERAWGYAAPNAPLLPVGVPAGVAEAAAAARAAAEAADAEAAEALGEAGADDGADGGAEAKADDDDDDDSLDDWEAAADEEEEQEKAAAGALTNLSGVPLYAEVLGADAEARLMGASRVGPAPEGDEPPPAGPGKKRAPRIDEWTHLGAVQTPQPYMSEAREAEVALEEQQRSAQMAQAQAGNTREARRKDRSMHKQAKTRHLREESLQGLYRRITVSVGDQARPRESANALTIKMQTAMDRCHVIGNKLETQYASAKAELRRASRRDNASLKYGRDLADNVAAELEELRAVVVDGQKLAERALGRDAAETVAAFQLRLDAAAAKELTLKTSLLEARYATWNQSWASQRARAGEPVEFTPLGKFADANWHRCALEAADVVIDASMLVEPLAGVFLNVRERAARAAAPAEESKSGGGKKGKKGGKKGGNKSGARAPTAPGAGRSSSSRGGRNKWDNNSDAAGAGADSAEDEAAQLQRDASRALERLCFVLTELGLPDAAANARALVLGGDTGDAIQQARVAAEAAHEAAAGATTASETPFFFPTETGSVMCAAEFQLRYAAARLPRPKGLPDERVSFCPDTWQRKLLDAVEARKSALVVQPTSAGKSFIAFYTIQRTLREGNDGVVVFVLPTWALVLNVSSEIQALYSKNYQGASAHMISVFSKEFHSDRLDEAQVVCTSPDGLSIFLNSPEYQAWAHDRVRYIIFDEVHNIADLGGAVWEETLLTCKAPFLALSATVGRPNEFNEWLASVAARKGQEFVYLTCPDSELVEPAAPEPPASQLVAERYNDLQPFLVSHDEDNNPVAIMPVHPVASVNAGADDSELHDALVALRLCPEHCISLHQELLRVLRQGAAAGTVEMPFRFLRRTAEEEDEAVAVAPVEVEGEEPRTGVDQPIADTAQLEELIAVLEDLHPSRFFQELPVPLARAHRYARRLLWVLERAARLNRGLCAQVVLALERDVGPPAVTATSEQLGLEYTKNKLLPALQAMRAADMMPALVFQFDKEHCNRMAKQLVEELEEQERQYKEAHREEWARELASLEAQLAAIDARRVHASQGSSGNKGGEDGERGGGRGGDDEQENDPVADQEEKDRIQQAIATLRYKMSGVLKEFTMSAMSAPSVDLRRLKYVMVNDRLDEDSIREDILLRAMQRGIGVHHMALKMQYRVAAEYLFRMREIGVVICTGTLAQGINMPARSVMMAGDGVEVHSTSYLQAVGRAGRRGYDDRGSIVHFGMPRLKVYRMLTSRPQGLVGHVIVSPAYMLRRIIAYDQVPLHHNTGKNVRSSAPAALREMLVKCSEMLVRARFGVPEADGAGQLLNEFHYRYAIATLVRAGLVDERGHPVQLAGLLSLLHFEERSALAFVHLLASGVLPAALAEAGDEGAPRVALAVAALLFCRLPLRKRLQRAAAAASAAAAAEEEAAAAQEGKAAEENDDGEESVPSHSEVVLDPASGRDIPPAVFQALRERSDADLTDFVKQTRAFLAQNREAFPPVRAMPVSGVEVGGSASASADSSDGLLGALAGSARKAELRTPFLAMRGHTDRFANVTEAIGSLRTDLRLSVEQVAALDDVEQPLNRYVLDFIAHKNKLLLEDENGLPDSRLHKYLSSMGEVLRSLAVALRVWRHAAVREEFSPRQDLERVARVYAQLAIDFMDAHKAIFMQRGWTIKPPPPRKVVASVNTKEEIWICRSCNTECQREMGRCFWCKAPKPAAVAAVFRTLKPKLVRR